MPIPALDTGKDSVSRSGRGLCRVLAGGNPPPALDHISSQMQGGNSDSNRGKHPPRSVRKDTKEGVGIAYHCPVSKSFSPTPAAATRREDITNVLTHSNSKCN